jgi:hypothetical protein
MSKHLSLDAAQADIYVCHNVSAAEKGFKPGPLFGSAALGARVSGRSCRPCERRGWTPGSCCLSRYPGSCYLSRPLGSCYLSRSPGSCYLSRPPGSCYLSRPPPRVGWEPSDSIVVLLSLPRPLHQPPLPSSYPISQKLTYFNAWTNELKRHRTLVNRLCAIVFNRFYRLEIHSLMIGIFDPACELLTQWTKELYLCIVCLLPLYLLSDH